MNSNNASHKERGYFSRKDQFPVSRKDLLKMSYFLVLSLCFEFKNISEAERAPKWTIKKEKARVQLNECLLCRQEALVSWVPEHC